MTLIFILDESGRRFTKNKVQTNLLNMDTRTPMKMLMKRASGAGISLNP